MSHGLKVKSTILWPIHRVDKHVVDDLIDHIVPSVENLRLMMALVEVALVVNCTRSTPARENKLTSNEAFHGLCIVSLYILFARLSALNWSIKNHNSYVCRVWSATLCEIPAFVGPEFLNTVDLSVSKFHSEIWVSSIPKRCNTMGSCKSHSV